MAVKLQGKVISKKNYVTPAELQAAKQENVNRKKPSKSKKK